MRSFTAFLFALHVLLVSLTPAGLAEAFRLPQLRAHFAEHQARSDGKLAITTFVVMHYFDAEHDSSEPAEHKDLPFHGPTVHATLYASQVHLDMVSASGVSEVGTPFPGQDDRVGQWSARGVFHPPKSIG